MGESRERLPCFFVPVMNNLAVPFLLAFIPCAIFVSGCDDPTRLENKGQEKSPILQNGPPPVEEATQPVVEEVIQPTEAETPPPAPVRALRLDNTDTDDAELEKISREYPELVELTLGNTKITDAGLVHLLQLKKLRKIRISQTAITDAGMSDLAKCEYLEDVDLSRTKIGDFGVWELRALPRLKNLNLYLTLVTDAGLDSFRRGEHRSAAKIERLNLDKCPITDAGLPKLESLTSLAWIHLGGTAITDAGLAELAKFETLKDAIVTKTETTLEGIEKLRKDRPDMTVKDNISENTPQEEIDEAAEYRKQLAPIRESGQGGRSQ